MVKVESRAKGAYSVLHGRDASCPSTKSKVVKVERRAKLSSIVAKGTNNLRVGGFFGFPVGNRFCILFSNVARFVEL